MQRYLTLKVSAVSAVLVLLPDSAFLTYFSGVSLSTLIYRPWWFLVANQQIRWPLSMVAGHSFSAISQSKVTQISVVADYNWVMWLWSRVNVTYCWYGLHWKICAVTVITIIFLCRNVLKEAGHLTSCCTKKQVGAIGHCLPLCYHDA